MSGIEPNSLEISVFGVKFESLFNGHGFGAFVMDEISIPNDKISIFGLAYCPYCKGAQKFLDKRRVQFNYIQVDDMDEPQKEKTLEFIGAVNKRKSFPTIIFGDTGEVVVGYDIKKLKDALEIMLAKYPNIQISA